MTSEMYSGSNHYKVYSRVEKKNEPGDTEVYSQTTTSNLQQIDAVHQCRFQAALDPFLIRCCTILNEVNIKSKY